ncbi:tetratricopeptide repeat protein [candidate division CSSED10-310 bacterium]|uniref:Tetratricopeptide repeat protein n=1 Tax=candidate division CSSED10-310 bacterium TaxID=2855610 RepID=A0ABV6Z3R4_UNCC1
MRTLFSMQFLRFLTLSFFISLLLNQPVISQNMDQEQEIQRLLALGQDHFKNWRYTNPQGSGKNALDVFQQVLKLDQDNKTAQDRINQMEAYYVRKVKQAQADGLDDKAKAYYQKILLINPGNTMARDALGLVPQPEPEKSIEAEQPAEPDALKPTPFQTSEIAEELRLERFKSYPPDLVTLLTQAMDLYRQRSSSDHTPIVKAIQNCKEVLKTNPKNYDALWIISRAYRWYGDHSPDEKKSEIFETGMEYAKKATEIIPNGIEGHYFYAVIIGNYAESRGIFNSLLYIDDIVRELEITLKLDPKHYDALTIMGVVYRDVPPWPVSIGDIDKAEQHLKKALALNPLNLFPQLELGVTYNKMKKWAQAKAEFKKLLDMPNERGYEVEGEEFKAEAREILLMMKRRGY